MLHSTLLSDTISPLIIDMIQHVGPSVVQVRSAGRGGGAGVIWRKDGAILTNAHVVGRGRAVQVVLADGRTLDATVRASDEALDLALLDVAASALPAAPVADSTSLRVGEMVFAIGHPWGQRDVVTAGIVSGVGDILVGRDGEQRAQYIRSDVRLAPGNSGGPLLNAQGEVIGINAMIFGGDLGVAIPSHVVTQWLGGLPERKITLGAQIQKVELPASARTNGHAHQASGLLVVGLVVGAAAQQSGLLVGDVLLDVEGTAVENPVALRTALAKQPTGIITLNVLRGGTLQQVQIAAAALVTE